MGIPRVIYTYWHAEERRPPLVEACIERMRAVHPEWTVRVMGPADLPADVAALPPNVASDWIRLHTLSELGGVWLDASCVCIEPVTRWIDCDADAFHGFVSYLGCADSYAFATPARHPLVVGWRDAFVESLADPRAYAERHAAAADAATFVAGGGPPLSRKLPYLNVVLCSRLAMRGVEPTTCRWTDAYGPLGPFAFDLDTLFRFRSLPPPMIKLDNVDRRDVARRMRAVTEDSSAGRALGVVPRKLRRSARFRATTLAS